MERPKIEIHNDKFSQIIEEEITTGIDEETEAVMIEDKQNKILAMTIFITAILTLLNFLAW